MNLLKRIFTPGEALSGKQFRKMCVRAVFLCVIFFILDQLTKQIIVWNLPLCSRIKVVPGFFNLSHVTNNGAAWNMFSGKKWFLLLISASAFAGGLIFFRQLTEYYKERIIAVTLVCSGILGNCFDRIFRGEVVDFLEFHISRYYWPSFNVADSCICIGVFLYLISSFLRPEKKKEQ